MNVISIGDQVRPGTYRLHSLFRRAANFTDGRRLVSLVTEDIGPGPTSIVVRDLAPLIPTRSFHPSPRGAGFKPAPQGGGGEAGWADPCGTEAPGSGNIGCGDRDGALCVGNRFVWFMNHRWAVSRTASYRSLLPYREKRPAVFRRNLRVLEHFLKDEAPPKSLAFLLDPSRERHFTSAFERAFVARVRAGAAMFLSPTGVRMLAGCGFGLTPSGDDFIAGMLIALHLLGAPRRTIRAVHAAAAGGSDLSRHFLALARDGRVDERMSALATALLDHGGTKVRQAAARVLGIGETSGADMMTGLVMTARTGVMECWSDGVPEKAGLRRFQYSSTPMLQQPHAKGGAR